MSREMLDFLNCKGMTIWVLFDLDLVPSAIGLPFLFYLIFGNSKALEFLYDNSLEDGLSRISISKFSLIILDKYLVTAAPF